MLTPVEYCSHCRKIGIGIEMTTPVKQLCDLPTTYEAKKKKHIWHYHEFFAYLLIPRDTEGRFAHVDCIVCIEEYDLSHIDLMSYVSKFLHETLLSKYPMIKDISLTKPILVPPVRYGCHKHRYYAREVAL
jgi:hypothetical protein